MDFAAPFPFFCLLQIGPNLDLFLKCSLRMGFSGPRVFFWAYVLMQMFGLITINPPEASTLLCDFHTDHECDVSRLFLQNTIRMAVIQWDLLQ